MSRKIILKPEDVSPELYKKLMLVKEHQDLTLNVFKNLDSRRKCFKLTSFPIRVHATEYLFRNFFKSVALAGQMRIIPYEEKENKKFVTAVAKLSTALGVPADYNDIMTSLESVSKTNVSAGQMIELIPDILFAYNTRTEPETLVLKLEYFFGSDVISIFDINGLDANTGRQRANLDRAREHATIYLSGRAVSEVNAENAELNRKRPRRSKSSEKKNAVI